MHILVVDDSDTHRFGASALLKGHELTVVGSYEEAETLLSKQKFDAYLGDLMLPASRKTLSPDSYHFVGEEMPLGTILAFLALKNGAKYVAVVTDMNHHKHPGSAAFDAFNGRDGAFSVGDARVLCTNACTTRLDQKTGERVDWQFLETEEGKKKYPPIEWQVNEGVVRSKDWAYALGLLTGEVRPR